MLPVRECTKCYMGLFRLTLNNSLLLRCSKVCRHYSSKRTHYEVLGLTRDASTEEIRAAYIKKSKECHPDKNSKDPTNHVQFISVNEAYTVLSKPLSRISYDALLQSEHVHRQSTSQFSQPQYHYPDIEIQRARDIRERDRMRSSYKRTPGSNRVANIKTVAGCILLIVAGSILHFLAFTWSTKLHLRNLEARDALARKQLLFAQEHLTQRGARASIFPTQDSGIPSDE
ncbi:hypothetical protein BsWGS_19924 [Bradybaena similaris]